MSYIDGPRGIGGWLTVFLVVMGLISPLVAVFGTVGALYGDPQVAAFYGPVWGTLQIAEWIVVGLTIACCWGVVWRLMFVFRWRSVQLAIAGIWIASVISNFADVLLVSWVAGLPLGQVAGGLGPEVIRPFVFGAVWTAYLLRSDRVANTYPRHADDTGVSEVFE